MNFTALVSWGKRHQVFLIILVVVVGFLVVRPGGALPSSFQGYDSSPLMEQSVGRSIGFSPPMASKSAEILNVAVPSDRKIVRNAQLTVRVDNPESQAVVVEDMVKNAKGFVEQLNVYEYGVNQKAATLTVRVPSTGLAAFIFSVKGLGEVVTESQQASDITEGYRDQQARLVNLKAREEKVREFYSRAKNVEETISVYRELEQIRSEIEMIERSLKLQDKEVEFSGVSIQLFPDVVIDDLQTSDWSIKKVWRESVNSLLNTGRVMVEMVIGAGVYSVFWIPFLLLFWWWRRQQR